MDLNNGKVSDNIFNAIKERNHEEYQYLNLLENIFSRFKLLIASHASSHRLKFSSAFKAMDKGFFAPVG